MTCAATRTIATSPKPPMFGLAARTALRDLPQKGWRHARSTIGVDWGPQGVPTETDLYEEVNFAPLEERLLEAMRDAWDGRVQIGTLEEYAAVSC